MPKLAVLILAAGHGKRMKSRRIKVLHEVCGKPMISHVIESARALTAESPMIVVGYQSELVKQSLGDSLTYVMQIEQKGTGHAVMQARELLLGRYDEVLILYGDTPLLTRRTLCELVEARRRVNAGCSVLSTVTSNPEGYGRIIRRVGGDIVEQIVEHRDATPEQLKVNEINSGIYCFLVDKLFEALPRLSADNSQGEYYLTDVPGIFKCSGIDTVVHQAPEEEGLGINDRKALAQAAAIMRNRIMDTLMLSGVTIEDPLNTYIDAEVSIGQDTLIRPFTMIRGKCVIGEQCEIGPGTVIHESTVGDDVIIESSVVEKSVVERGVHIGPFAHLRPNSTVKSGAAIGNFAEVKNSVIGENSKVHHHSYIGDSIVGKGVNFSAGAITVNYDGHAKHKTIMEDSSFIGCNANLIAPVRIGKGAFVAAGSTINQDVPPDALAIARERQVNKEGWAKGQRDKKSGQKQR